MLIHTILLATLPVKAIESANGHSRLIVLVEKPAGLALHTQAAEPVSAHGLPVAASAREVSCGMVAGSGVSGGGDVNSGGGGDILIGMDNGDGCGGLGGTAFEAAFEIET